MFNWQQRLERKTSAILIKRRCIQVGLIFIGWERQTHLFTCIIYCVYIYFIPQSQLKIFYLLDNDLFGHCALAFLELQWLVQRWRQLQIFIRWYICYWLVQGRWQHSLPFAYSVHYFCVHTVGWRGLSSAGPHDIHHQGGGGQTDGVQQTGTAHLSTNHCSARVSNIFDLLLQTSVCYCVVLSMFRAVFLSSGETEVDIWQPTVPHARQSEHNKTNKMKTVSWTDACISCCFICFLLEWTHGNGEEPVHPA